MRGRRFFPRPDGTIVDRNGGKWLPENLYQEGRERWRGRIRQMQQITDAQNQTIQSQAETITRLEHESQVAAGKLEAALGEIRASHQFADRLTKLIEKLTGDLARSPEIMAESLLTGIAAIYNPPITIAPTDELPNITATSMGTQGLDDMAGVQPGQFFPDVEFDDSIESRDQWPTPGTMSDPTTASQPQASQSNGMSSGYPRKGTGPMFGSGQSAPPPAGGVE